MRTINTKMRKGVCDKYPLIRHLIEKGVMMDTRDLRVEVMCMKVELEKSRYDDLTGFLLRGSWYTELQRTIIDAYAPLKDIEDADNEQAIALLMAAAYNLKHQDIFLVFGDVALLNFANALGERYGDALITMIVKLLNKYLIFSKVEDDGMWGRLGGDEFAGIYEGQSLLSIRHMISEFEENLGKCHVSECLPHFAEQGIIPRFNLGVATLEEACYLTATIIEQEGGRDKNKMDLLMNMFVAIADGRSKINKGVNHISLVAKLLQGMFTGNQDRYWKLRPYILKGCLGVPVLQLWRFVIINTVCQKKIFENTVLKYVIHKMKKGVSNSVDILIAEVIATPWKK